MHFTALETHKAKKRHRCSWCLEFIEEGTEYKRYRYFKFGEVGTVKAHPECYEAMLDAAIEEGGYIEFTSGQERPQVTVKGGE